jgi:hypothetical protein
LHLLLCLQVSYTPDLGAHQEYFLGAGGVFNLYTSLTGEELPGATDAVAQVIACDGVLHCYVLLTCVFGSFKGRAI